jgi:hypothetical protein
MSTPLRTFVNKPGVAYDALKTKVIFAEDMNSIKDHITDLETGEGTDGDVNWGGNTNGAKKSIGSIDNQDIGILTNNTERITVLKGGNVGIGTTGPGANLTVNGVGTGTGAGPFAGYPAVFQVNAPNANPWGFVFSRDDLAASYGEILLYNAGNASNGGVWELASVKSDNSGYLPTINSGALNTHFTVYDTRVGANESRPLFGDFETVSLNQRTGNSFLGDLNITNQGNVGIGTTGPTSKLTVYDAHNTTTARISASDDVVTAGDWVGLNFTMRSANDYGGAVRLISKNSSGTYLDPRLGFFTEPESDNQLSSMVERLSILSGGNVGIGTTSPTAYLHLKAGTATANTAPLKFTAGVVNTVSVAGCVEFDGTDFFLNV